MNASPDALLSASPVRQTDDSSGGEPKRSSPDSLFALDLLHESARASSQLNHDTSFSGSRFFQIGKLTLKQSWIHEMCAPAPELLGNESVLAAKKNQLHLSVHLEISAVCFLQRRTSQNSVLSCGSAPFDQLAQTFQPRPSVLIRQRNALAHLLYVGSWMKIVGLIEAPVELLREQLADGGLSGPRYTENDYDHMTI